MKYEIVSWNAVIPEGNTFPMPMLYIQPDENFAEYAKVNDYQILAEIDGTKSGYDGKKIVGVINPSSNFPDYRPNFYNKEGIWTITLFAQWKGYPLTNGRVLIRGTEGPDKIRNNPSNFDDGITQPFPTLLAPFKEDYTHRKKCDNFSKNQIVIILLFFILILCVFVAFSKKT